jgi:hypothetical protein
MFRTRSVPSLVQSERHSVAPCFHALIHAALSDTSEMTSYQKAVIGWLSHPHRFSSAWVMNLRSIALHG